MFTFVPHHIFEPAMKKRRAGFKERPRPTQPRVVEKGEKLTIGAWFRLNPDARVSRSELLRVIEGFELVTKQEVLTAIANWEALRRMNVWWRRLGRWLKLTFWPISKQKLHDLPKEARDRVRDELDLADAKAANEAPPAPQTEPRAMPDG